MLTFVAINVYLSSQLQEESTDDGSSSPRHYAPSPPPVSRIASTSTPPLTPQSSKKIFMETLLMPTPNTIDSVFDEEKALELFASNHKDIQISVSDCVGIVCIAPLFPLCLFVSVSLLSYKCLQAGPQWNTKPPSLTITVSDRASQTRTSGIRLPKLYNVRTKVCCIVKTTL